MNPRFFPLSLVNREIMVHYDGNGAFLCYNKKKEKIVLKENVFFKLSYCSRLDVIGYFFNIFFSLLHSIHIILLYFFVSVEIASLVFPLTALNQLGIHYDFKQVMGKNFVKKDYFYCRFVLRMIVNRYLLAIFICYKRIFVPKDGKVHSNYSIFCFFKRKSV